MIYRALTGLTKTAVNLGDMRIATTAALGAGTKTLETLSLSTIVAAY